jgi:phosphatidylglycerol:prolipoprotein diacylglycerol transferase
VEEGQIVGSEPYRFQLSLAKLSGDELRSLPIHPTQLYEAIGALAAFFFLYYYLSKRASFKGQIALAYLAIYAVLRFVIEIFRADPRGDWAGFSTSQWISIAMLLLAFLLWSPLKRIHLKNQSKEEFV